MHTYRYEESPGNFHNKGLQDLSAPTKPARGKAVFLSPALGAIATATGNPGHKDQTQLQRL